MDVKFLQRQARHAFSRQQFWKNVPQSHRDHIANKAFENSISFSSKEQTTEIFWQCWGPDRGEKLYKKLAQEYNVGYEGIINIVRGSYNGLHSWCPVDESTLKKMKEDWSKKYQTYKVCAVIPGKDQLDNYDCLYKESGQYKKVKLPWKLTTPSVVFYCRFLLKNPTPITIREYCDSIGIPRLKNDLGQYKQILNHSFTWLKNSNSKTFEFNSFKELGEFLTNHLDNKDKIIVSREAAWDYVKNRFQWRGENFLGWMFYIKYQEI